MFRFRFLLKLALALMPAIAPGQLFNELWRIDDSFQRSDYSAAAFIKNDRTVFVRSTADLEEPYTPGPQSVECVDAFGNSVWTYQMADLGWSTKSVLTTNDDRIYINFGYCILALTQDGEFVWRYDLPATLDMRAMRIFGDKLFIVGTDFATPNQPQATYMALNRQVGTLDYVHGNPGYIGYYDVDELKASGPSAFFKFTHPEYGGSIIIKIEAATGDALGFYLDPGKTINRMTVDSQSMLYVGIRMASGWSLRKVDCSGAGSYPPIYDRTLPLHPGPICLSKGFLYTISYEGAESYGTFYKINPATGADVLTAEMLSEYQSPMAISADKYGRLYVHWQYGRASQVRNTIESIDPTGGRLHYATLSDYYTFGWEPYSSTSFAFNSNAELFVASGRYNVSGHAARHIQSMELQPDAYSVNAGETLTTSGNGVAVNDRYVYLPLSVVTVVTPPAQGVLTMQPNGEFSYVATGAPLGTQTFTYRITRQTFSATQSVTITVLPGPFALSLNKYSLAGQNSTIGTVRVATVGAARTMTLRDNSSLVSMPLAVTIPAGQTAVSFRVQVQAVNAQINTTIFASLGGLTRSVPLRLVPLTPTALLFTPSIVVGGNTVSCRIVINGVAGPGGRTISVYDDSAYCHTPAQVVVPAGATSVTFTIQTTQPPTALYVKVTASVSAGTAAATMRITP